MKTRIFTMFILFFAIISFNKISAQGANTSLSNLIAPTSVNVSLVPKSKNHNLGSLAKPWQLLYLDSAIFLNGTKFITNKAGTATDNIAIGLNVLTSTTNGSGNAGIGFNTLHNNKSGNGNFAAGSEALYFNSTGSDNIAIGRTALYENTKGNSNIAIGNTALIDNTTSNYNVAVGENALALLNDGSGSCTAVGEEGGDGNLTGSNNIFIGASAGEAGSSGDNNTMVGNEAGFYSYGNNNTYLGYHAANSVTSGSSNTIIGFGADVSAGTLTNATALGNYAIVHANNSVRIGNSSVTSIGGFANWSNVSDGRVKKNIKQNVPGLAFINKLTPVTYNLNLDAVDNIVDHAVIKNKEGKPIQPSQFEIDARKAKEQIVYTGFIAQDVEAAAKKIGYDFSGVDVAKNEHDLYGLRYSDFVVPLVKGMQELSAQNDSLKQIVNSLQSQINELKTLIVSNHSFADAEQSAIVSSPLLSQNNPNPFSSSTIISYSIPQPFSSAKIIITDKNGNALKQINLSSKSGNVHIDASTLINGAYQYSLIIDEKIISTKQMILAK